MDPNDHVPLDVTDDRAKPFDPDATLDAPFSGRAADRDAAPGAIGPYRIVRRLGTGGMGDVYLAEQTAPIRRRVALKVIKQGMDTRAVVARFEKERQTLAMMNHPGIAQVFDAGETPAGRPYFAMEYVEGVPIREYCDALRLNTRQRLELFIQVCHAIQHAHQKAVIHRDLKPGNILVAEVDGKPAPKIIDFGIARATEQRDLELTVITRYGRAVGTPAYMSPEQTDPLNVDIDTRTDIYALGVVLYELLVGATPLDVKQAAATGYDAVMTLIREKQAPRPSTRVRQTTVADAEIAENRGTDPKRLVRTLRGDLDWILLKTLEKDRSRRYETAYGLAMDIGRYLRDEPVLASRPGAGYRAGKFVRRHRTAVTVAAAASVVLIAFATVSTIQAGVIARARDRANLAADKAQSINTFLTDMLASSDPWRGGEHDMTVVEAIDRSAATVDSVFAGQPLVAAEVHATMGRTYLGLQKLPKAEVEARKGLDLYLAQEGPDALDVADSWIDLAKIARYNEQGELAERAAREAIRIRSRHLDPSDQLLVAARGELAQALITANRFASADSVFDAMEIDLADADRDTRSERADIMGSRAAVAIDLENPAAADSLGRGAVALLQASDPDSPQLPTFVNDVAVRLLQQGKLDEARAAFEQAVDLNAKVFGQDHPEYAAALENLGNVAYRQGHPEETLDILARVRDIRARNLGEDHPTVIRTMLNMAVVADIMGDKEKALAIYADAIPRMVAAYGEHSNDTAVALCNVASTLRNVGRLAEAEADLRRADAAFTAVNGPDQPAGARVGYELGRIRIAQERWSDAAELLEHVIAVAEPAMGRQGILVQRTAAALVEAYDHLGDQAKADKYRAYAEPE